MKILITSVNDNGSGTFVSESSEYPEAGKKYWMENADDATESQNRLFHALIGIYQKSGLHPTHGGDDFATIKNMVKRDLGAGFESFAYIADDPEDGHPIIVDVKKYSDIPKKIRELPWKSKVIRGRLKSWGDYSKHQRRDTIDRLIHDMLAHGVNSKKFEDILQSIGFEQ